MDIDPKKDGHWSKKIRWTLIKKIVGHWSKKRWILIKKKMDIDLKIVRLNLKKVWHFPKKVGH